jgi:AcrR family transcriptional regulator
MAVESTAKIGAVENKNEDGFRRLYTLGKRQELSDQRRVNILAAARKLLESEGYPGLTMELLARESRVSRQTVHNLFKTKAGVLEALFDELALSGGMERMGEVMRTVMSGTDPEAILEGYVRVFAGFWSKDRLLLRRIRGIATFDPDFEAALGARNQRRRFTAPKVVERLTKLRGAPAPAAEVRLAEALYAMTSFEYFDVLADAVGSEAEATEALVAQLKALLLR